MSRDPAPKRADLKAVMNAVGIPREERDRTTYELTAEAYRLGWADRELIAGVDPAGELIPQDERLRQANDRLRLAYRQADTARVDVTNRLHQLRGKLEAALKLADGDPDTASLSGIVRDILDDLA